MKTRVLLAVPTLRGGGSQRVVSRLARYLDREQFEIHLALVKIEGPFLNDIPRDVPIHCLGGGRVRWAFFSLLKLIWRLKPQAVLSVQGLSLALTILKPLLPRGTRLLIRDGRPISEAIAIGVLPRYWRWLVRAFYRRANRIICQFEDMAEDFRKHFWIPKRKLLKIYNPIDVEALNREAAQGNSPFEAFGTGPHVLGIGRLEWVKGFDRLIGMFPEILKQHDGAHLWLLGEGAAKNELEELARKLGVSERTHFAGFQKNPYRWLSHADLFVLASRHEGLPNVLLEALAVGCPVAAVKHPGGTAEVMRLCGLETRYADTLTWNERWLERGDVERARGLLEKYFGLETILRQYSEVLAGTNR